MGKKRTKGHLLGDQMQIEVACSAFLRRPCVSARFPPNSPLRLNPHGWWLTRYLLLVSMMIITELKPPNLLHRRAQLRGNLCSKCPSDVACNIFLAILFVLFISTRHHISVKQGYRGKCPHLITRWWPMWSCVQTERASGLVWDQNCNTMWTKPFPAHHPLC